MILKFDRATQPYLKIDVRHESYRDEKKHYQYDMGLFLLFDMRYIKTSFKVDMMNCKKKLPFLNFDMYHLGPPSRAPAEIWQSVLALKINLVLILKSCVDAALYALCKIWQRFI